MQKYSRDFKKQQNMGVWLVIVWSCQSKLINSVSFLVDLAGTPAVSLFNYLYIFFSLFFLFLYPFVVCPCSVSENPLSAGPIREAHSLSEVSPPSTLTGCRF